MQVDHAEPRHRQKGSWKDVAEADGDDEVGSEAGELVLPIGATQAVDDGKFTTMDQGELGIAPTGCPALGQRVGEDRPEPALRQLPLEKAHRLEVRIGELGRPIDIGEPDRHDAALQPVQQAVDGQIRGEVVFFLHRLVSACAALREPSF